MVLTNIEDSCLPSRVCLGEKYAIGYTDTAEVFVIIHDREAGVIVALAFFRISMLLQEPEYNTYSEVSDYVPLSWRFVTARLDLN